MFGAGLAQVLGAWGGPIVELSLIAGALVALAKLGKATWTRLMLLRDLVLNVQLIAEQVTPNGGKSMHDALLRIEDSVRIVRHMMVGFLHGNDHAMAWMDADGEVTFANRTFQRWTGRGMLELVGHGWLNAVARDDREPVAVECRVARDNRTDIETAFELDAIDGSAFLVRMNADIQQDELGVIGWAMTLRKEESY